jgi:hypothetical protein
MTISIFQLVNLIKYNSLCSNELVVVDNSFYLRSRAFSTLFFFILDTNDTEYSTNCRGDL